MCERIIFSFEKCPVSEEHVEKKCHAKKTTTSPAVLEDDQHHAWDGRRNEHVSVDLGVYLPRHVPSEVLLRGFWPDRAVGEW